MPQVTEQRFSTSYKLDGRTVRVTLSQEGTRRLQALLMSKKIRHSIKNVS